MTVLSPSRECQTYKCKIFWCSYNSQKCNDYFHNCINFNKCNKTSHKPNKKIPISVTLKFCKCNTSENVLWVTTLHDLRKVGLFCLSWARRQLTQIWSANRLPLFLKWLCCWLCCSCLVFCDRYVSTGTMHTKGKHTKYNWVNLLGWLVWVLHNATYTAVIDNINERINIACDTHNELSDFTLNM